MSELHRKVRSFEGGCIKSKFHEWCKLTSDAEILNTVSGLSIELCGDLPDTTPVQYPLGSEQHEFVMQEITRLLDKKVIRRSCHEEGEFISPIFLRPKNDGKFRMILNLRKLNEVSEKQHFKMDTLKSVLTLVYPGAFMCKLDIKDAYYSVPIAEEDQKLLKFMYDGLLYQFLGLPNGYTKGPRKFTKLLKPVLAALRKRGITLAAYLDDIIIIAKTYRHCMESLLILIEVLGDLGFVIHPEKSVFVPSRKIEFLGFIINSLDMTVRLTTEKKDKILQPCIDILDKSSNDEIITIRDIAKLLGKFSSSFIGVTEGKLHFRYLERNKTDALSWNKGKFDAPFYFYEEAEEEVIWWMENIRSSWSLIIHDNPDLVMTSDACKGGWGACAEVTQTGGLFSEAEREEHINVLESKAVLFALKSLYDNSEDVHIKVLSDNTATVGALNNMGSSKSLKLHKVICQIWEWALSKGVWLSASHIPGVLNEITDKESRKNATLTEWMISDDLFRYVIDRLGFTPVIDLFASRINNKLARFASYRPDPEAELIDAFSTSWSGLAFYAFPPFICISRVLQKIRKDMASGILVVPDWPNQPWYNVYRELVVTDIILYPREDLLLLPTNKELLHPMHKTLSLRAGLVSATGL